MEQIAVNAEVHFHEQELVSIFHETNVADSEDQFAELVFAGAFAIRSMSNLGPHAVTDSLAKYLQMLGHMIVESPAIPGDAGNPEKRGVLLRCFRKLGP